jgi:hypothetical protein
MTKKKNDNMDYRPTHPLVSLASLSTTLRALANHEAPAGIDPIKLFVAVVS